MKRDERVAAVKILSVAVRQRENFGHRNRVIGPYEVFTDRIS